jgi:alpha-galactosidase
MGFFASDLPPGLGLDSRSGEITGSVAKSGDYTVSLRAKNSHGTTERKFRIVIGEEIALTPPMGWNSWNCWGSSVDADKVLRSAKAMAHSGLIDHGWTYINIDDGWQGKRGGPFNALQGNAKFPAMKALSDQVHKLSLKLGIYSTPWVTSYANYPGGSAENPEGTWEKPTIPKRGNVNSSLGDWQILVRHERRPPMGRVGH